MYNGVIRRYQLSEGQRCHGIIRNSTHQLISMKTSGQLHDTVADSTVWHKDNADKRSPLFVFLS